MLYYGLNTESEEAARNEPATATSSIALAPFRIVKRSASQPLHKAANGSGHTSAINEDPRKADPPTMSQERSHRSSTYIDAPCRKWLARLP